MNNETVLRILLRKLYGEATSQERELFDRWLSEDESHQDLYDRLNNREFLLHEYERRKAVDYDRPLKEMESKIKKKKSLLGYVGATVIGMAASLAVGAFLFRGGPQQESPAVPDINYIESIVPGHTFATMIHPDGEVIGLTGEDEIPARISSLGVDAQVADTLAASVAVAEISKVTLNVPRGGEFHIVLEDSTEVWLNSESSLEYPESFSESERAVEVTGEAYFKVKKDETRPFLVKLYGQVVRVYGTEFGVASYPEDEYVYTTLVEGKVGIMPENLPSASLYLAPDSQSVFSKADATATVRTVNAKLVTSWKDGLFVFEDQTLAQIMVQLSRWYDFEYRFADERAASIQFKGRMPRYGKFVDLLKILQMSGGIQFSSEGNCVIISSENTSTNS